MRTHDFPNEEIRSNLSAEARRSIVHAVVMELRRATIPIACAAFLIVVVASAQRTRLLEKLWDLPAAALLLASVVLSVALVLGAQQYVHHRFKYRDFVYHNEVAGFIVSVVGTLYAVLLGFITIVAWQHYTEARGLVATESAATTDAWHVALSLPADRRARVRRDLIEYTNLMIRHEWPQMRHGSPDELTGIVEMDAIGAAEGFRPADLGQANAQTATLQQLGVMHDNRQRRIADNGSAVSWFEWLVLIIGAICVLCFCWLFGLPNGRVHLIMTAIVTILITSTLVLLFELQFPFRTSVGISAGDWSAVLDHIHWMQASSAMNMRM